MTPPNRFVVPEELAGSRIDLFLARQDPEHSRRLYQRAIAEGRVRLNGRQVKKWERLAAGDAVEVEPFEPASAGPRPDPAVPLVAVYEDEALLVVDKPAGVPVHPRRADETGTLASALVARYPELVGIGSQPLEPGLVHRLDTQTSGLLVVARTPAAFRALASAFAERRVEKVYIALVLGSPLAAGSITTPIGHHPADERRMIVEGDPAGPPRSPRPAVTHFAVRRRYAGYTELEVRIDTGRMHQIRAHLASIGHPLAGDPLYQKPAEFGRDRLGLGRPFLHAARLAFDHPAGGHRLEVSAPLPPDLVTALARLEEAGPAEPPAAEAAPPPAKRSKRAPKAAAPAPRRFIRRPGAGRRELSPPVEAARSSSRVDLDVSEPHAGPARDGRPGRPPRAPARGGKPARPQRLEGAGRYAGLPRPGEVFGVDPERPPRARPPDRRQEPREERGRRGRPEPRRSSRDRAPQARAPGPRGRSEARRGPDDRGPRGRPKR